MKLFSVAIPAYKREFLAEAIGSVVAQTYGNWELIIVDDASPNNLDSVVAPFLDDTRVHYFKNSSNIGAVDVVDNWNKCLKYSAGDFFICMGDDDRLLPDCLQNLSVLMDKYPDFGVYHSRTQTISSDGSLVDTLEERPETENSLEMMLGRWQGRAQYIGDFCFRSDLLKKNGGFAKFPLAWGADDVSAYIASKGDGANLSDGVANSNIPGFQYRESASSISSDSNYRIKLNALISCREWFRKDLDSRKKKGGIFPEGLEDAFAAKFKSFSEYYVRKDATRSPGSCFYWLKHKKATGLSFIDIIVLSLKGIITGR